jgi:hypothetical protein
MVARIDLVRHVLRIWDPIGVIGSDDDEHDADDEYDGYAGDVLAKLEAGETAASVAGHLAWIRSESIGLGRSGPDESERSIAQALAVWRDSGFAEVPALAKSPAAAKVRCHLHLMFEWRGGCLWSGDHRARRRFDVGPLEDRLSLPAALRARLETLSTWHDTALDWTDPTGPSPWGDEERRLFEADALEIRDALQDELGPGYLIVYRPLG